MEPNDAFVATLESFFFLKPFKNGTTNIFRDALYNYSEAKLKKLLDDTYFECLTYHFSFEVDPSEMDEDLKIGLEMINEAKELKSVP